MEDERNKLHGEHREHYRGLWITRRRNSLIAYMVGSMSFVFSMAMVFALYVWEKQFTKNFFNITSRTFKVLMVYYTVYTLVFAVVYVLQSKTHVFENSIRKMAVDGDMEYNTAYGLSCFAKSSFAMVGLLGLQVFVVRSQTGIILANYGFLGAVLIATLVQVIFLLLVVCITDDVYRGIIEYADKIESKL